MEIRHFRYFVAVGEALSFARAARNLNISQSALSMRIADLEDELGLKLFNRTKRKVELTAAGEAYLPHARDVVRVYEDALCAARSLSPSKSRRLGIALPSETAGVLLLDIVNRLQQERVSVHVFEASTGDQQQLLAAGEIAIGVFRHPFDEGGLWVSAPLAQPIGVMMDAGHALAKRDKLRFPDLCPYPLVYFLPYHAPDFHRELLDLCRAGGYVPPKILNLSGRSMVTASLKAEAGVRLVAERRFGSYIEPGSEGLTWRPLETSGGSPVHWWISVVCRSGECVGITRVAVDTVLAALQRHENWVPMPRGAPAEGMKGNGLGHPALNRNRLKADKLIDSQIRKQAL